MKAFVIAVGGARHMHGASFQLQQGDLIQILESGTNLPPCFDLRDLLFDGDSWQLEEPLRFSSSFRHFWVLHDSGARGIDADYYVINSVYDFQAFVSDILSYEYPRTTLKTASPRLQDAVFKGVLCKAIVLVTMCLPTIPVPPGRVEPARVVVFLDMRPVLKGFDWRILVGGEADYANFVAGLRLAEPLGFSVHLQGCDLKTHRGVGFIQATDRTVITVSYRPTVPESVTIRDGAIRSGSSSESSSSSDPGSDGGPDGCVRPKHPRRSRTPPGRRGRRNKGPTAALCSEHASGLQGDLKCGFRRPCSPKGLRQSCIQVVALESPISLVVFGHATPVVESVSLCPCTPLRAGRTCKFLTEPRPGGTAAEVSLANLRYISSRLGAPWRYLTPPQALVFGEDSSSCEEDAETPLQVINVHFLLLTPGFRPERISLSLGIPSTIVELVPRVRAARCQRRALRFPRLVPAHPQPAIGEGIFLACPTWSLQGDLTHCQICLDCSAIDGRVFSAFAPCYISGQGLIALANLPGNLDFRVYAGPFSDSLQSDALCHLSEGETIFFTPHDAAEPNAVPLPIALLGQRPWNRRPEVPAPEGDNAYCVVFGIESVLYLANPGRPTAFRDQLASCVGVQRRFLRIVPSQPRIEDVAVDGVPCRTVLSVYEDIPPVSSRDPWILLDLRDLFMGWQSLRADEGVISCRDLIDKISQTVGRGNPLRIQGFPDNGDLLEVSPGQVLIVSAREGATPDALDPNSGNGIAAAAATPQTESVGQSATGDSTDLHTSHGPDQQEAGPPREHDDVGEDALSGPDRQGQNSDQAVGVQAFMQVPFLLLKPDYIEEWVSVRLAVGIEVAAALNVVAEARHPNDSTRMPVVCAVHPQPCSAFALTVCLPEWPFAGAIVVIDSRDVNGRIFAVQVIGHLCRLDFLQLAGISDDSDADVFFRDLPWALPLDSQVRPINGDLVVIQSSTADFYISSNLADMLRSADGWGSYPAPLPNVSDIAWILGSEGPRSLYVPPHRQARAREAIATFTGIPAHGLYLSPAFGGVSDFAPQGLLVRNVVVARAQRAEEGQRPQRHPVCILDLRPLLLGFDWCQCPEGIFDTSRILARFEHRCPEHFHLGRVRNGSAFDPFDVPFLIQDGDVIVCAFRRNTSSDFFAGESLSRGLLNQGAHGDRRQGGTDPAGEPTQDGVPQNSPPRGASTGGSTPMQRPQAGTGAWKRDEGDTSIVYAGASKSTGRLPMLSLRHVASGSASKCHAHRGSGIRKGFLAILLCANSVCPSESVPLHAFFVPPTEPYQGCTVLSLDKLLDSRRPYVVDSFDTGEQARYLTIPTPMRTSVVPSGVRGNASSSMLGTEILRCNHLVPGLGDTCEELRTLLEVSVQDSQGRPLFLARTLVETLEEELRSRDGHVRCQISHPRGWTCIGARHRSVADSPPDFDLHRPLSFGNLPLGFTGAQIHQLFQPEFRCLSLRDSLLSLAPRLRQPFLAFLAQGFGAAEAGCRCYVDGSFKPALGEERPAMGWACVFLDDTNGACGVISGPMPNWCSLQLSPGSAFQAECCAMIVGFWLGVSGWQGRRFTIFSDCQAVVDIANGSAVSRAVELACVLGNVAGCCRVLAPEGIQVVHIPGHAGLVGNELADIAAKSAAAGFPVGHLVWQRAQEPEWWNLQGHLWSWCGVVCQWAMGDDALPPPTGDDFMQGRTGLKVHASQILAPFLNLEQPGERHVEPCIADLCLRLASYNALSLAGDGKGPRDEGLAFVPAKPALLAQQLHNHGIVCAAIQEARTEEGFVCTGGFLRYCSGAQRGHFGVELWFRSGFSLVRHEDTPDKFPVVFSRESFVVLHQDPRRLVVLFKQGSLQIAFASLHAPHRGSDPDVISEWWQTTEKILEKESRGRPLVMGADCNAAVGSVESRSISSAEAESQDFAGECMHTLLHKCELWAPATWPDVQCGEGWTYMQRRNGATTRIDYVLLPLAWRQGSVHTWTEPGITAGNLVIDHLATVAEVKLKIRCGPGARVDPRKRIDVQALSHPSSRETLKGILASAPRPSWEVSAHEHAAEITAYLQKELAQAFPQNRGRPLHPFLSETAWDLQKEVSRLRRRCAQVRANIRRLTLHAVFDAWCGRQSGSSVGSGASQWLRDAQCAGALYGFRLGFFARALRSRCKADKAVYVSALADQVQLHPERAFQAVNALLCRRRKKPYAPAVLPAVRDAKGRPCASPQEAINRWRQHFSDLEAGEEVTPEGLMQRIRDKKDRSWPSPEELSLLPSPFDLQKALACAQKGKACGPDLIPGEAGILCASEMQQVLYPLALKLGLAGEEAVGYKCGTLTWLFKGRGERMECGSFRGILLLSTLCKAIHRAYRPCIQRHYEAHAPALQLSGKKGGNVIFGSHLARTFLRWRSRQGLSGAILFADVAAAYYSAKRELAVRHPDDELTVDAGSEACVFDQGQDSLEVQLAQPSALSQNGAGEWLRAVATVLNEDTWMCLQQDDTPVMTNQGTRPGSAWADLTFGVLVGRILKVKNHLKTQYDGSAADIEVCWDGARHWGPGEQCDRTVNLADLVWADDVSSCIAVSSAPDLAKAVGSEAGSLDDAFCAHGFALTYGPRKTAALLCPRGKRAREVRRQLFRKNPTLPVLRENGGVASLPLVDAYKHLGVMQMHEGGIRLEVKQRCAAAWTAFREGRTKVFRCRRVSTSRRGALLDTLVISKLRFGCGAWPPLGVVEMRIFGGALSSIYRATLGLTHQADQHVSLATICALLGLVDHDTTLKVEQLRYVRQLVSHAPDALWALIRQDEPYLAGIREAFAWLFARVRATTTLPDPLLDWGPWCEACVNRPGLFKGLIKRAKGLECCRIQCYAAFQALYRALRTCSVGVLMREEVQPRTYSEACLICKKGFESRAAWACHASKLHGYRLASSVMAGSSGAWVCQGCGRCYAKPARLRRHLLHSSTCRKRWGSFTPGEGFVAPDLHERQPPVDVAGILAEVHEAEDPASYSRGLKQALEQLQSPDAETIWATVVEFVEPLSVLRRTLQLWLESVIFPAGTEEAVEDVLLMLDPDVCCTSFRQTPHKQPVTTCCPDLPGPLNSSMPFVLTGASIGFDLADPPCHAFSYPFVGGTSLAAARRQSAYVEHACDVLGHMVQQSQSTRVILRASRQALASLEPAPTWLLSVGFALSGEGLASPIG